MDGAGANLQLAALPANTRQLRNAADVNERFRLAEAKFHDGDQAVTARDELRFTVGRAELFERVVDRRRPAVLECRRNHDWPP
jgi:hypothetical protein